MKKSAAQAYFFENFNYFLDVTCKIFLVLQENIPPIIATIRSLSSSGKPVLVQLSYSLYSSLWKTEERCYQFLSDELTNSKKEWDGFHNDYHLDVVTASVIRDICVLKWVQTSNYIWALFYFLRNVYYLLTLKLFQQ